MIDWKEIDRETAKAEAAKNEINAKGTARQIVSAWKAECKVKMSKKAEAQLLYIVEELLKLVFCDKQKKPARKKKNA